jgi:hypothetical protein
MQAKLICKGNKKAAKYFSKKMDETQQLTINIGYYLVKKSNIKLRIKA